MEEAAIFAVGTFWFWVLMGSVCSALIGAVEYDKWGSATFTLLFSLFLLDKCGDVPIWSTIWAYPLTILAILGVYLAVEALWAIVKWWFFVRVHGQEGRAGKASWRCVAGAPLVECHPAFECCVVAMVSLGHLVAPSSHR